MNRLTDTSTDSRNCAAARIYCDTQAALKKLFEYENTGLEPAEVASIIEEYKTDTETIGNLRKQITVEQVKYAQLELELYQLRSNNNKLEQQLHIKNLKAGAEDDK